jgi:hypothetical protein
MNLLFIRKEKHTLNKNIDDDEIFYLFFFYKSER